MFFLPWVFVFPESANRSRLTLGKLLAKAEDRLDELSTNPGDYGLGAVVCPTERASMIQNADHAA